jgi:hypothetical protein
MTTEALNFKIGVSGTYWSKRPEFAIRVNDTEYVRTTISGESGSVETHEFSVDLPEGPAVLAVVLLNKADGDTVTETDADGTWTILQDMLLNIESIIIDDIDIGNLRHKASEYVLDTPVVNNGKTITTMRECVNLGWNGAYKIAFESPFYIWLLENM